MKQEEGWSNGWTVVVSVGGVQFLRNKSYLFKFSGVPPHYSEVHNVCVCAVFLLEIVAWQVQHFGTVNCNNDL